jgi:hypothetical protein
MTDFTKFLAIAALGVGMFAAQTPTASANDTGAFLGGLAAGAIVGGAIAGGGRGPVYGAPAPAYGYGGPPVYYQRACWTEMRPIFNQFGQPIGQQPIRVCR